MTLKERLYILEELLDIGKDTLELDERLDRIDEWDSIAIISTIAMFDSLFGKTITSEEIKNFKTVRDIVDKME